jgi:hypothetical protein
MKSTAWGLKESLLTTYAHEKYIQENDSHLRHRLDWSTGIALAYFSIGRYDITTETWGDPIEDRVHHLFDGFFRIYTCLEI